MKHHKGKGGRRGNSSGSRRISRSVSRSNSPNANEIKDGNGRGKNNKVFINDKEVLI